MADRSLPSPICARLPDDLDAAIRARAEAEGLSPSEMLRAIIAQWVYGTTPSVDEGYHQARSLATKLAHEAVSRAIAELPQTYDEAVEMIAADTLARTGRRG